MVSGQGNSLLKSKVLLNTSYRAPSCVFWLALLRLMSIIPLRISWDITLVSLPLPWSLEDTPFLKSLQKEGLSESTSSSAWWRPHLCRVRHSHRVALGGPEGRGGEYPSAVAPESCCWYPWPSTRLLEAAPSLEGFSGRPFWKL